MKKIIWFFTIIALVAAIGFSLIACGDDGDGDAKITISGTLSSGTAAASVARNTLGSTQRFSGEVQTDNAISGLLEDGAMIFKLSGIYEPATKAFSMQAASSLFVFSLAGKLTASNNIDPSSSHASVQVKDQYGEWSTIELNITPGNQTVSGTVNQTGGIPIPAAFQGRWYDHIVGAQFLVTENSITQFDAGSIQDLPVVEITIVDANTVKLLYRANWITQGNPIISYTGRVYARLGTELDSTLSSAIGSAALNDVTFGSGNNTPLSTAVTALPAGQKMFVAPYCGTGVNVSKTGIYPAGDYSPLFIGSSATASAKNENNPLKAISGWTYAMMKIPREPAGPGPIGPTPQPGNGD